MSCEKVAKEEHTTTVKSEDVYCGIDPQGFGDFDHYTIVQVRTGFKVGQKVKVTVKVIE